MTVQLNISSARGWGYGSGGVGSGRSTISVTTAGGGAAVEQAKHASSGTINNALQKLWLFPSELFKIVITQSL